METPYIPASLEPLTDSCWHITLPHLRTTNTRLHVCIWATPTEKTNSLIHRRTENKQNLSLWELMRSDQNRTLMWAFVFSSAPLPSVRQSEYCIRVCVCVVVCVRASKVSVCLSACEHNGLREIRLKGEKDKWKRDAWWEGWYSCLTEGFEYSQSLPHHPPRCVNVTLEKKKKKKTWTHTFSLLLLRFELQIGFKKVNRSLL